jgi:hypothetical protein
MCRGPRGPCGGFHEYAPAAFPGRSGRYLARMRRPVSCGHGVPPTPRLGAHSSQFAGVTVAPMRSETIALVAVVVIVLLIAGFFGVMWLWINAPS